MTVSVARSISPALKRIPIWPTSDNPQENPSHLFFISYPLIPLVPQITHHLAPHRHYHFINNTMRQQKPPYQQQDTRQAANTAYQRYSTKRKIAKNSHHNDPS
jgi:hypothetical protein